MAEVEVALVFHMTEMNVASQIRVNSINSKSIRYTSINRCSSYNKSNSYNNNNNNKNKSDMTLEALRSLNRQHGNQLRKVQP
ncbi:protein PIEZO homolog [Anoplophora glabripennis]|uniref:protein PIEZO homolog n=1 Tax=Anoplophora glabripennis TaxID=217634 RepID=UPI000C76C97C|nr:protein PIEZO homolog [Anoplophora glabripennis]